jgi:PAT family beta-lactamase induction signal transducer AmpG
LQAVAVALALGLAVLDPMAQGGGALRALAVAVLLTNLVAATQDVPTDGLAVRVLDEASRGLGNGVQVGAYRAGMIVGGGVLLVAWEALGWPAAMLGMAAVLALASAPLALAPAVGAAPVPARPERAHPWDWIGRDGAWAWVAVLVIYKLGDHLAQGMIRPWLVDVGYSEGDIGALLGLGGFFAGLVGALGGGWAVPRVGLGVALVGFSALQITGPLAYALAVAAGPTWPVVAAAAAWDHLAGGMATAALFTAMMQASRPSDAATDYTLQASVVVLASGLGAALSGVVAAQVGYLGVFLTGAALAVLAPLLVARPAMRRVLG